MEGNSDDSRIARDRYGRPLKDRYGRPIYRRTDDSHSARSSSHQRSSEPPRSRRSDSSHASRRPIPPRPDNSARASAPRHAARPAPQRRPQPQPERRQAPNPVRPQRPARPEQPVRRQQPMNETRLQPRPGAMSGGSADYDPRFPPPGYNPDADFRGSSHGAYGKNQQYYPAAPQAGAGGAAGGGAGAAIGARGGKKRFSMPHFRMPRMRFKTIILVIVIFLVAMMALVDVRLTRVDAFSGLEDRPSNTMASNWLLVGSDSRAGLSEEDAAKLSTGSGDFGQRTDTIMIAHVPLFGKPKLVSIPRDSFVEIPGNDQNKINAAFAFGGPQLLIDTVEKNTGIHIDHYAEIGFGGFAGVVDAVGGIEMCPEEPIDDPLAGINIQAGCQKFDGASALGYVRTRATAQGDLDRVQRQREFMGALMGRLKSPAVWLNPYRWIRLSSAGTKAMFVGDGDHVWHLSWLLVRMLFGADSITVPTSGAMDTGYAGNVLLWDEQQAPALFEELK
ncbi:MAG: LCP family protein [Corynebacterium sp.]|uniref:LCP family protein n=1 Tax=Corynebacterium sp. TaxID=1720 RepID=UPI0026DAA566|nr:LCP family protein [Corynebacterium sp.]MDO5029979.1 LCP family protein [Corynebacterium sp.]